MELNALIASIMREPREVCCFLRQSPVAAAVLPPVCAQNNRVMLTGRRCASTSRLPDISAIADLILSDRDRHTVCVSHPETNHCVRL